VQEFYDNSNVFITGEYIKFLNVQIRNFSLFLGASGFVGKAVVEKLLRSCDGIKNIYILLRPKRNQSIEIRFESYLKNKAFDRVRKIDSEVLDKIKFISGDMTQSKLGMSTENYEFMRNEINIVLNVAASVNMNDSLDKALNLNALGTKRVLDLAEAMPHLKVFDQFIRYFDILIF
jgi:fatty acyl-CoA reductase